MLKKHRRAGQPYLTMRDLSMPEEKARRSSVLVGPFKTQTDEPAGVQALAPTYVAYQPRNQQNYSQGAGMVGSVIKSQAWPALPPASQSAFRFTSQQTNAIHAKDQRPRALFLAQAQDTQTPPRIVMKLSPVRKDLIRHPGNSRYK